MSVTSIDPTKQKQPFVSVDPPKTEAKKPTINQDAQASAPKPDFTAFVAAQTPQKLTGPGVSSSVFGPASPNVSAMSDKQLVDNIGKLTAAMKASPGKVNAADFAYLRAMTDAANKRANVYLTQTKPVGGLTHDELYTELIAYDVARASGAKLTKEQEARFAALEKERETRTKYDPSSDIKRLEGDRKHYAEKMAVHCGAAAVNLAAIASQNPVVGAAGALIVVGHAAHDGHAGEVGFEGALGVAGLFAHASEGVAFFANSYQCFDAKEKYKQADASYTNLTGAK
jgi:hypothetical protein